MKSPIELSIIIPAFNEERRLPQTLERVRTFLGTRAGSNEVIVVDDGSTDRTAQLVEEMSATWTELRLLKNPGNRGKGYSVRHGMLQAKGRIVLFTDADLSAPIEEADKLFAALETHDVAIGSRAVDRSVIEVHQPISREMAGILFNRVMRLILELPYHDTQCGFKAFAGNRGQILFEQQRIERFGFDPELLFLAKRHGLTVAEVPVRWSHDEGTRVHALRDGLRMVFDVFRVRWNSLLGRYPRQKGT
ncbi:MAG TPA: dolichyl-phosphate beta-glucosyltransferase [Candidatus Acidoferrales bacterium]|jgi:glycosyltransferase involved in cell wall biosynthesis|nr:dolichyl-phosphate beta-glucosyltransferase [Candidatus Acidoferrales bacterium]